MHANEFVLDFRRNKSDALQTQNNNECWYLTFTVREGQKLEHRMFLQFNFKVECIYVY